MQAIAQSFPLFAKGHKDHTVYRVQSRVETSDYQENYQSTPTRDFTVDAPSEKQLWWTKDQRQERERNIESPGRSRKID
jgi:hypothetical protein